MKKENFMPDVKGAVDIALFRKQAMHHAASNTKGNMCALIILVISAILSTVGFQIFSPYAPTLGMALGMIVYQVVFMIIGIYVLSVISVKIFKGHAKHDAFFRVIAFGMIVTWLNFFPPLEVITGLWGIALIFVILKEVHKLTTGGAIGTMLVSLIALVLIGIILSPFFSRLGVYDYNHTVRFDGGMMRMGGYGDDFEMNFRTEDGEGTMEMEGGVMKIEGPDGEMMEIEIPNFR